MLRVETLIDGVYVRLGAQIDNEIWGTSTLVRALHAHLRYESVSFNVATKKNALADVLTKLVTQWRIRGPYFATPSQARVIGCAEPISGPSLVHYCVNLLFEQWVQMGVISLTPLAFVNLDRLDLWMSSCVLLMEQGCT